MNPQDWVVSNGLSQFGVVLKTTRTIKDTDCVWRSKHLHLKLKPPNSKLMNREEMKACLYFLP